MIMIVVMEMIEVMIIMVMVIGMIVMNYLQTSSPIETPSAARFLFKLGEVSTSPLPPLSH